MRWVLNLLGYRVEYVSDWGVHSRRYNSLDASMGRPIHADMSVAPPWAKLRIVRADSRATKDGEGET